MLGLGLKPLQDILNRKADEIQREFIQLGEEVDHLNSELLQLEGDGRKAALAKQKQLRGRRQQLS